MDELTATDWFTQLGYTKTNCYDPNNPSVPNSMVSLALYCENTNGKCNYGSGGPIPWNNSVVNVNHIAIRMPNKQWSSKMAYGYLISHPNFVINYTPLFMCFEGKTWMEKPVSSSDWKSRPINKTDFIFDSVPTSLEEHVKIGRISDSEMKFLKIQMSKIPIALQERYSKRYLQLSLATHALGPTGADALRDRSSLY